MKEIVVVGGGTAGWLTALYAKKVFPKQNVTVIQSKDIGILGAGEGSVPKLINLLDLLEIPVAHLVRDCDATIKNGIKFTNWNKDKGFYYHSFQSSRELSLDGIGIDKSYISTLPSLASSVSHKEKLNSFDFVQKLSEKNLVPLIKIQGVPSNSNRILDFQNLGTFSIHFNAVKLANKLQSIAEKRKIKCIEKTIVDVVLDEEKNIKSLSLEDGSSVNCDFVFDCSGFAKLIIGKLYNGKWNSHLSKLPVDSAIPFFLEMDKEIPPYTESIAMKYGWMWKIPLQSRYGCGYVYDSSLISEDEAIAELEEFIGFKPEYPRKDKGSFKFTPGYYEEPWINNCIAIGLSSGFIEPLEATSIWTSILSLSYVLSSPEMLYKNNQSARDDFNKYFRNISNQVIDFIYFHYMTDRDDTEFWKKFTYENAPDSLKNTLDLWDVRLPKVSDSWGKIWGIESWLSVASGLNKINQGLIDIVLEKSEIQKQSNKIYLEQKRLHDQLLLVCAKHKEFLDYIR